ncbi:MAG TPA: DinB family protein [Terracidiphilus sp.]|nr:DinB family protein [Terracidiphilus sp.]
MNFDLDSASALLARTPAALDSLLRGLPACWTEANEGEKTMTPREVVAHLIDADQTNWLTRIRAILEHGALQPIPGFDRYAKIRASAKTPIADLLDEFTAVRAAKLDELRALHLMPDDLKKHGQHPALGAVTVSELVATWTAHDLTHLHQVSRILAHQYADAVGPFERFLGVLKCEGHGG